jgi:hypothetical protein
MNKAAIMRQSTGGKMRGAHHGQPGLSGQRLDGATRVAKRHGGSRPGKRKSKRK